MRTRRRTKTRHLVIYLLAIVLPALVLLALAWQSMARQRQAISALTEANLRLSAGRLADVVEARVAVLARAALDDLRRALQPLALETGTGFAAWHGRVRALEGSHPIVRTVFVLDRSGSIYPRLASVRAGDLDDLVDASRPTAASARLLRQFGASERDELVTGQLERAMRGYHALAASDGPRPLRALALARTARVATKLARADVARGALDTLSRAFPEETDLFGHPFGLSAVLSLARDHQVEEAQAATTAYQQLVDGRWPLDAEQASYFASAFEHVLGRPESTRPRTAYLEGFDVAAAANGRADLRAAIPAGEILATTLADGRFGAMYASGPRDTCIGIALDTAWLDAELVPQEARALATPGTASLVSRTDGLPAPAVTAPLRSALAGWSVAVTPAEDAGGRHELAATAGTILSVLLVLGLGLALLQRDVARDAELNALRQDFVAGVSHDLKTPVTLIRLYAEALDDDPDAPPGDRRGFYQIILRESERLSRLVERVVGLARAERTGTTWQFQDTHLEEVLTSALESYGPYLRRRGFECRVDVAPGVRPVSADADAVGEALVNLLDNAVKYSGTSREVVVRLSMRTGTRDAVLDVQDFGIGIPAGEIDRVFERFYRSRHTEGQGGYGLGLFLVKHVMDAHGGRVEVESAPGTGSTFRLVFPTLSGPTLPEDARDAEDPGR